MPARLRDLARVLKHFGVEVVEGGGRHNYRATKLGYRLFPIPAHGGWRSEVTDKYINKACQNFGIDRAELWKLLRDG